MISHRCRYKARGSVLMRVFTSSSVRWVAARVTLAISSLFSFQSSPPLFYHSTRISIRSYLNSSIAHVLLVNDLTCGCSHGMRVRLTHFVRGEVSLHRVEEAISLSGLSTSPKQANEVRVEASRCMSARYS